MDNIVPNKDNVIRLSAEWPYRLFGTTVVIFIIILSCAITITIKEELVSKQIDAITNSFYDLTSKNGFLIDDIIINGRNRSTKQEISNAINLSRNDNILKVDLHMIKSQLEKLPWVRNAVVKRTFFPNLLQVSIEEKEICAVWQHNEKFYRIDFDGKVVDADFRSNVPVLLIVGDKAPENLRNLLEAFSKTNAEYLKRIKVANFISERRWNLILDDIENGITIKLPEENPQKAWEKLLKLNETKGILKRKLTIIDLRLDNKVIVKLKKSPTEALLLNKTKEHEL